MQSLNEKYNDYLATWTDDCDGILNKTNKLPNQTPTRIQTYVNYLKLLNAYGQKLGGGIETLKVWFVRWEEL